MDQSAVLEENMSVLFDRTPLFAEGRSPLPNASAVMGGVRSCTTVKENVSYSRLKTPKPPSVPIRVQFC
jgi:hypothetical protein